MSKKSFTLFCGGCARDTFGCAGYLDFRSVNPRTPGTLFIVNPELDTETLPAHACESLASANVMTMDLADQMEGPSRNSLLGIAQIIMLGELAVNRALDNIDPQG
ncbi:DUF6124 family protein [Pseudomonas sp. LB3P14]